MLSEPTLEFSKNDIAVESGPVRTASLLEESAAVQIIRMGFSADPIARWTYPDPVHYNSLFPEFTRAFAGRAFDHDSAFIAVGNAGAALWLPPGVGPDEDTVMRILETTASPLIKRDLFAIFEQMGAFHPQEPHWYLPMIAVDPYRQGQGVGSSLMKHALERCDEEQMPAYLESSNPRNITLYQRCGFEITGIIQSGGSPPMFPMLRKPRTGAV